MSEFKRRLVAARRRMVLPELDDMEVWLRIPTFGDVVAVQAQGPMTNGADIALRLFIRCAESEDGSTLLQPDDFDWLSRRIPKQTLEKIMVVTKELIERGREDIVTDAPVPNRTSLLN